MWVITYPRGNSKVTHDAHGLFYSIIFAVFLFSFSKWQWRVKQFCQIRFRVTRFLDKCKNKEENSSSYNLRQNIVDTFTFSTHYFVTVLSFCPPRLRFQHPFPQTMLFMGNYCDLELQTSNIWWERGLFCSLNWEKERSLIWCTKTAIERQCVN